MNAALFLLLMRQAANAVPDSTVSPVDVATVWTMRPANRLASVNVSGRLATAQPAIRLGTVER